MPRRSRLLHPFALAIALAAPPALAQESEVNADTVLATVNGTEITAGHLVLLKAQLPQQYQSMSDDTLYAPLLQQAIQQLLLSQSIEDLGTAGRLAMDNQNRQLRANIAMRELAEEAVTEEALQAAYDARYAAAEPGREFNAAHILVESEEEAEDLRRELAGGADFSALARSHSIGPSGPNGGDLGWFGVGTMVPEFETAVQALEPGQVSQPTQTQFGWHLIQLRETRLAEVPSLEAVREELAASLREKAVADRLAELEAAADLERQPSEAVGSDFLSRPGLIED